MIYSRRKWKETCLKQRKKNVSSFNETISISFSFSPRTTPIYLIKINFNTDIRTSSIQVVATLEKAFHNLISILF